MHTNTRPDFCFSAAVLSAIDAVDICEAFGLACDGDLDEDLFDDHAAYTHAMQGNTAVCTAPKA